MEAAEHPYERVERELRGTAFARIRYLRRTGSTNEDAAALLGDSGAFGTSVVAEEQTHGAGRKGRSWIASPGSSLLVTTILPRSIPASHLWVVPFGVAICVRRALHVSGIPSDLHWPNDLLTGGKKIAGILCVSRIAGDEAWVGAGVGINVHRPADADASIAPPPAFCDDVNPNVDRATLLRDVLLNYEVWSDQLEMPQRIARVWERWAGLPKRYSILKDGETEPIDVTALGLSNNGGLIVQHDDGRRETISLADARALR
ncbi:MAG TPA: biotin--[acetyl-CoA-carboxylase] ligase [Candidatus Baltobacteraceae bacterium]|nr:biotin--[acetyl-CoA-carboxylase] ligase [Candidatus Baltobacteraceae bacterium]